MTSRAHTEKSLRSAPIVVFVSFLTTLWGQPAWAQKICKSELECSVGQECRQGRCFDPPPPPAAPAPTAVTPRTASPATATAPAPNAAPVAAAAEPSSSEPAPMETLGQVSDGTTPAPAPAQPALEEVNLGGRHPIVEHEPKEVGSANIHFELRAGTSVDTVPSFEFGRRVTGLFRVRLPIASTFQHATSNGGVAANVASHDYGVAAGVRWYITGDGNQYGFYIGQTVEYYSRLTYGNNTSVAFNPGFLSVFELGYRWVSDGILFGMGMQGGGRTTFDVGAGAPGSLANDDGLVLAFAAHIGGFISGNQH